MAVLSCLPEEATSAKARTAASQPNSQSSTEELLAATENPIPAARSTIDEWEEVRADGVYCLPLRKPSFQSTKEGSTTEQWSAPSPQLHPWPIPGAVDFNIRSNTILGASSSPEKVPVVSLDGQRQQFGFTKDKDLNSSGVKYSKKGSGEDGEQNGGGESGRTEPDRKPDTDEVEGKSTAEKVYLSAGERADSLDEKHGISSAALGLLSKLRDSIHRRVRSIPYHGALRVLPCAEEKNVCLQPNRGKVEAKGGTLRKMKGAVVDGAKSEETVVKSGVERYTENGLNCPQGDGCMASAVVSLPARVGVLFSGGLDSVVLAAMLAEGSGEGGRGPAVPIGEAIDLINVCFDR